MKKKKTNKASILDFIRFEERVLLTGEDQHPEPLHTVVMIVAMRTCCVCQGLN